MGGCPDVVTGQSHLEAFWGAYQKVHGSHTLFHQHVDGRCWSNTLALALHGDEGRGLKKSNTTIITMETVLGVNTWENMCRKRTAFECNECHLDGSMAKRFRVQSGCLKGHSGASLCQFQSTNLKQHSFLTKFVLAALPNKDSALLDKLSIAIVRDMKSLFEEGLTVTSANNQVERWLVCSVHRNERRSQMVSESGRSNTEFCITNCCEQSYVSRMPRWFKGIPFRGLC